MKMKKAWFFAPALLCGAFPQDGIAQTISAFGVGIDSCHAYLANTVTPPGQSSSRIGPDGRDYYSKSTAYLEWLLGFVTGYNATVSDPARQVRLDPAAIDIHVRTWCSKNPESNIFTAVHQLLGKGRPD
jgi:hypothetical protein